MVLLLVHVHNCKKPRKKRKLPLALSKLEATGSFMEELPSMSGGSLNPEIMGSIRWVDDIRYQSIQLAR